MHVERKTGHTIEYMRLFLVKVERGNEPELYTLLVVLLTLTSSQEQKKRGVITASAGNHAVALAYHGRQLNIPVTVVLPMNAPKVKVRIVSSRFYISLIPKPSHCPVFDFL